MPDNVFQSVVLEPGGEPAAPESGQHWFNSILGEPRVRRGAASETLLTNPSHQALDTLLHDVIENADVEDTYDAEGCITARTWRAPGGGVTIRVVDQYTFDAEGDISGLRIRQFTGTGSVAQTLTLTRTGTVWTQVLS